MKSKREQSWREVAVALSLVGLIAAMTVPAYSARRPGVSGVARAAFLARHTTSPTGRVIRPDGPKSILIYGPSLDSFTTPNEATLAEAAGYSVTVADAGTWSAMTTAQFAAYNAIVFPDPSCSEIGLSLLAQADANKSIWSAAITGPIYIQGTDPVWHGAFDDEPVPATQTLITNGINFVAHGSHTGLYVSLSCYYEGWDSAETPIEFLTGIGDFRAGGDCADTVTILRPDHPAMAGLTDQSLSDWSCSVHEFLTTFPSRFEILATAVRPSDGSRIPYLIAANSLADSIDDTTFFVRQHYLDFLGREPDPLFAEWVNLIDRCAAGDPNCDRIHVSEAFFRSPEFGDRGYYVWRFYPVSFPNVAGVDPPGAGHKPEFEEFTVDLRTVSGFLTDAQLEAAKAEFALNFTQRPAFVARYNGLGDSDYVNTLCNTAGVTLSNQAALVTALTNKTLTRAQVLRQIAESPEVFDKYRNEAFVVMQYFGYLRRNPDALYFDWIKVLDANPSDSRHMIEGFVNSIEYRKRFEP